MGALTTSAPAAPEEAPSPERPGSASDRPATGRLVRCGAIAGLAAATAATAVAAASSAADVPLTVDRTAIPPGAFAWWTVIAAVLGTVLARVVRARRRFVLVASVLTALSLVPALAAPDDLATRVVLVGCHLLAAAILIPALARPFPARAAGS